MKFLQKVVDFLNPVRVEEIQDKVGTVLFALVGLIGTALKVIEQFAG